MIVSSTRLRNSGRKLARSASITLALISGTFDSFIPRIACDPRLLVMITTVLRKSTTLPWPSVRRPSSSTWSRMLNTSGCAFSISSNRITLYGRRRIASESCPPSSYPT